MTSLNSTLQALPLQAHAGPTRSAISIGYDNLLEAMQQAIAADMEQHPAEQALIIYLGDLIDRGPNSLDVIDDDHRLQGKP